MQLGKLLKLGSQVWRRSLLHRSCVLLRRGSILLGLCICCTLLICLIILLLRSSILLRVLLLLVVVYSTGCASHDRCAYDSPTYAGYRSSHRCSSAHHIYLLILFVIVLQLELFSGLING